MTAPGIEIRELSKRYRRGMFGAATLREELQQAFGKQADPASSKEFYALKDVSFSVPKGGICGLIGPNGSGKTTLMKILASITEPTHGSAVLRGRVGSLLEVGAGFDPELDGIENIYLNGAILGMSRREIRGKLDQIIAFADVGPVLETPVKRYSSGMYVRLAFAVAAHLDAEILLVDEVLAVGDAQFQQKCLAAMRDLAASGRTIMFVSHNMATVSQLCDHGVFLRAGQVAKSGPIAGVVDAYMTEMAMQGAAAAVSASGVSARILVRGPDGADSPDLVFNEPCAFELQIETPIGAEDLTACITLRSEDGVLIASMESMQEGLAPLRIASSGRLVFSIDAMPLLPGSYYAGCVIRRASDQEPVLEVDTLHAFEIIPAQLPGAADSYSRQHGMVRVPAQPHFQAD